MTRAYLRLDPAFDEHKADYPDGPYSALIATFCLADSQPTRGRFRSLGYLRALLGKRGRHVPFLLSHGDIVELPDKRVYIDGWDEWQEGDWTVGERVRRIRNRKGPRPTAGGAAATVDVTADVTPHVTVDVTAGRQTAPVRRNPSSAGGGAGNSAGRALTADRSAPANGAHHDDPYDEVTAWLGQRKAWIRDGSNVSVDLARMVDRKGADVVIEAMSRVEGAEDAAQFVYGARNALFPLGASVVDSEPDPADVKRQLRERRQGGQAHA